jgi:hypothetical protein
MQVYNAAEGGRCRGFDYLIARRGAIKYSKPRHLRAVTGGPRKIVGVMHKDGRRYAMTGGWGFEGFVGDSRTERAVGSQAASACFGCHEARKANDFVFSSLGP